VILCQKVIPTAVDTHGRMVSNTYCMLPSGHDGPCKPETEPRVVEVLGVGRKNDSPCKQA
jgi:hypothetical protein